MQDSLAINQNSGRQSETRCEPAAATRYDWAPEAVGKGYQGLLEHRWYNSINEQLLEMSGPKVGETIADIGCGPGSCLEGLAAKVGVSGRVIGMDVSPAMIAMARDKAASLTGRFFFVVGDAEQACRLVAGRVDRAFLFNSIYHMPNPVKVLQSVFADLLKPGGEMALNVGFVSDAVPYENRKEILAVKRAIGTLIDIPRQDAPSTADARRNIFVASSAQYRQICEAVGFRVLKAELRMQDIPAESWAQFFSIPGFGNELLPLRLGLSQEERTRLFHEAVKKTGIETFHRQWFFLTAEKPKHGINSLRMPSL